MECPDARLPNYSDALEKTPEDGSQPAAQENEDKEDDSRSVHIHLTEHVADLQPPVQMEAVLNPSVQQPQGTCHAVIPRGYIPIEQVLSPATPSTCTLQH